MAILCVLQYSLLYSMSYAFILVDIPYYYSGVLLLVHLLRFSLTSNLIMLTYLLTPPNSPCHTEHFRWSCVSIRVGRCNSWPVCLVWAPLPPPSLLLLFPVWIHCRMFYRRLSLLAMCIHAYLFSVYIYAYIDRALCICVHECQFVCMCHFFEYV